MGRRGRSRSLATQPLPQPLPVARPIARDLLSVRSAAGRRGGGPLFASSREKATRVGWAKERLKNNFPHLLSPHPASPQTGEAAVVKLCLSRS